MPEKKAKNNVGVGAFGEYTPRYLSISREDLAKVTAVSGYYNVFRYEMFHKIMEDFSQEFFPNGSKTPLSTIKKFSAEIMRSDEYRAVTLAIYDCDYKKLKAFCAKYYGSDFKKDGRVFSKIVGWWIEQNQELLSKINSIERAQPQRTLK